MAAVGSCPLPILFLPEAPLLPISASESPSFGPGPPLPSLLACLIQSSCPSTAILVCLSRCLPSRPSFRPHCSSLFHQLLPASPNLQVTQGILLITLLSLGPLLGTQDAEQCTIWLYLGHPPTKHTPVCLLLSVLHLLLCPMLAPEAAPVWTTF